MPLDLIHGYRIASNQTRDRAAKYVAQVWSSAGSYRDADVNRIIKKVVPVVQAAQRNVAVMTDAYVAALAKQAGVPYKLGVNVAEVVNYRGVPAEEVYRRPAVAMYTALSKGEPFSVAVAVGLAKMTMLALTDVEQSKNRQATASGSRSGFTYTLRVLGPGNNCDLCVIASTQRYKVTELMPIHPRCSCGVETVMGDREAPKLDAESLSVKSEDPTSLITTHEHGELGPTLALAGEHFTGPSQIRAKDYNTFDEFAAARAAERAARSRS